MVAKGSRVGVGEGEGVGGLALLRYRRRDSRVSGGSTASPPPLLEDQAQLLLLSLLVPCAYCLFCIIGVESSWWPYYLPRESNIKEVQRLLYAIYKEYSNAAIEKFQGSKSNSESQDSNTSIQSNKEHTTFSSRWTEFSSYLKEIEMIQPEKSELDVYLEEGCHRHNPNDAFNALGWWKLNTYKFLVLLTLARDILAIPISTVASEATFSAEGYVIDKYRACLAPTTVEVLMCDGDWCQKRHEVTKKSKVNFGCNKRNGELLEWQKDGELWNGSMNG
ncbi:hypothetical protein ZIOFF_069666 [Zingiber officinale]|uniref:HAT C-terminal dimerisation domain-containing protein n=1 Tax=Zingiber officinale TaxID=94328 RepID=A0A8J5ECY1_ZINOF|nr:hypothetical protein ZIOFF_069666 [Zingiber officinale]